VDFKKVVEEYNSSRKDTHEDINNFYIKTIKDWNIVDDWIKSLKAKNYTEFVYKNGKEKGRSVETPHDNCHGLIGNTAHSGRDYTLLGDMSSPNVAGFDPVFWLHHCYVDYILEVWWVQENNTISPSEFGPTRRVLSFHNGVKKFNVFPGLKAVTRGNHADYTLDDRLLEVLKANDGVRYRGNINPQTLNVAPRVFHAGVGMVAMAPDFVPGEEFVAPALQKYKFIVNRLDIPGPFTVYARSKTGELLDKRFIFNRFDPSECENCTSVPALRLIFNLPEPPVISYALGFAGQEEIPAGDAIVPKAADE